MPGDDRRLDEEAAVAVRVAAGEDRRLRLLGALEEADNAVLLVLRDHRAHLDLVALGRIADVQRLDGGYELLDELVVDLRAGDDTRGSRAVLTRVPVAGDLDRLGHSGRVGVVEDDDRSLAAELEVDALEVVRSRPRNGLAGLDVAGQGDEAHLGMLDESLADGHAVAGDDVEHARRDHVGGELHEAEKRERSLLGRLQHLDVPGRERGRELPDGHHERVVPGSDAGDDADRLAPEHGGVAPHVLAGRAAFEHARRTGEEADVVRGHGHLVPRVGQGLADVLGLEGRKLLGVLLDQSRRA